MSNFDHFTKPLRSEQATNDERAPREEKLLSMQVQSHPILRNGFMRPQIISNDSKLTKVDLESHIQNSGNDSMLTNKAAGLNGINNNNTNNNNNNSSSANESPGVAKLLPNHPGNASSDKKPFSSQQVFHSNEIKTAVVVTTNNKAENRTINSLLDSSKAREAFFAKLKNAESTFNRQFNENSSSSTSSSSSLSSSPSLVSSPAISSSSTSSESSADTSHSDASSTCSSSATSIKAAGLQEERTKSATVNSTSDTKTTADITKRLFQNQHRPFDLKTNFNNVVKIDTKFKREPTIIAPVLPVSLTMNAPMIKELKNRLESLNVSIQSKGKVEVHDDSDGESLKSTNYQRMAPSELSLLKRNEKQPSAEASIKKKQEIQKEALKSLLSKRRNSAATNASRTTNGSKSLEPIHVSLNKSTGEPQAEAKDNQSGSKANLPDKIKPLPPKSTR